VLDVGAEAVVAAARILYRENFSRFLSVSY
jgi:hypothetical protein